MSGWDVIASVPIGDAIVSEAHGTARGLMGICLATWRASQLLRPDLYGALAARKEVVSSFGIGSSKRHPQLISGGRSQQLEVLDGASLGIEVDAHHLQKRGTNRHIESLSN